MPILQIDPLPFRFDLTKGNMSKKDTRFKPGLSGNHDTKWKPGQSGNPAGVSKRRAAFERDFNDALISVGSAEEAVGLLWDAARNKEAWAIQELCRRFAPPEHSLRLIQETKDDSIDYTRLTNEQLEQLHAILKAPSDQPDTIDGREGPTQSI
jgi:hypothetical protein